MRIVRRNILHGLVLSRLLSLWLQIAVHEQLRKRVWTHGIIRPVGFDGVDDLTPCLAEC